MMLAQPGWLLLLLLLPLLAVGALLMSRLRRRQWSEFVAPRLRRALLRRGSPLPRWFSLSLLLAACGALTLALARPQGDGGTEVQTVTGRNALIALDLSRSMRVQDVNPDRLGQAKVLIYEMLEAMPDDRVGLIGFAGRPVLFAPLTNDLAAVRETVEQVDENWVPVGGSNLAAAIQLGIETLRETGQRTNALILISDGEENQGQLDGVIDEAERAGLYVFAIGVGTAEGGFVPHPEFPGGQALDRSGQPVLSRLIPEGLRELSSETGGRYVTLGSGVDIPAMVRAAVQDMEAFEMEGRERRVTVEFYQWLLLPAILFLMASVVAGTRWRGLRAATVSAAAAAPPRRISREVAQPAASVGLLLLACAIVPGTTARASELGRAADALAQGQHEEARDGFRAAAERARGLDRRSRLRLAEGASAYRAEDFRGARGAFSEALLADSAEVRAEAHLGMGNTLFQLGWLGLARESYPSDPEALPDLNRFDTLVRERLAQLRTTEPPESGQPGAYTRFESLILNWSDAARHYQSARETRSDDPVATRNRELVLTYLRRLVQLLDEDERQTEQMIPEPQEGEGEPEDGQGEGEPQEGEGESEEGEEGEPQDGQGEGADEPREGGGDGDQEPEDEGGEGGEQEPQDSPEEPGENEGEGEGEAPDPNESPEDRARRILRENADLERGAPRQGRFEFRDPLNDW